MADVSLKSCPPPPPFTVTSRTQLEDWKEWQKSYWCYAHDVSLYQQSQGVQLSTFKSIIGPDALKIYNTFTIMDTTDLESVMAKFDEHFKPKVNVTLERYKLYKMSQQPGQEFDEFLADVTSQVDKCEFKSMSDEIALYKIVGGIEDEEVRKALLADENLNFDRAVQVCRASMARHFMTGDDIMASINDDRMTSKKNKQPPKMKLPNNEPVCRTPKLSSSRLSPKKKHKSGYKIETPKASNIEQSKVNGGNNQLLSETSKMLMQDSGKNVLDEESAGANIARRTRGVGLEQGGCKDKENAFDSVDEDRSPDDGDSDWRADDDDGDDDSGEHGISKVVKRDVANVPENARSSPCEVCGKSFSRKGALTRHTMLHKSGKDFTCYHCGKQFKISFYLKRHMVRAHSEIMGTAPKVYTCDICSYKSIVKQNMQRHKFQHTEDKPLSCQLCDYKCTVRHLMVSHMVKHTGEMPFVCEVCNKGFRESGALKTHMIIHTDKPFACKGCDFRTAHRSELLTHRNTNHPVSPFTCTVCSYTSNYRSGLKAHMKIHSGDKPFACKLCNRKFRQSGHLSYHMRTHTGEKPFVCEVCGHRWAVQANLRQHMKVHQKHSGDPGQQLPTRKRRSKPKNPEPSIEPPVPPGNVIPQWSEQVSMIDPTECFPGLGTPSPFNQPFPAQQGNPRPPSSDCRFLETRQWPNQN